MTNQKPEHIAYRLPTMEIQPEQIAAFQNALWGKRDPGITTGQAWLAALRAMCIPVPEQGAKTVEDAAIIIEELRAEIRRNHETLHRMADSMDDLEKRLAFEKSCNRKRAALIAAIKGACIGWSDSAGVVYLIADYESHQRMEGRNTGHVYNPVVNGGNLHSGHGGAE